MGINIIKVKRDGGIRHNFYYEATERTAHKVVLVKRTPIKRVLGRLSIRFRNVLGKVLTNKKVK
jgi:hypothetical protein